MKYGVYPINAMSFLMDCYFSVRPQDEVRAEIIRSKGSQFDPAVADIMVQMIDDDTDYRMREFTLSS